MNSFQSALSSYEEDVSRIASVLQQYDHILVLAHAHPDADALGSSAAMVYLLRQLGKKVCLFNSSGIPNFLSWVDLPVRCVTSVQDLPFEPELAVVLDCGDLWRVGKEFADNLQSIPSINIDHHVGNPHFGTVDNWVEPKMAATGQMVAYIAKEAGIPLEGALAEYIYLALIGDTGSFSFGNTTAEVFELAAELFRNGLDAVALREKMEKQWTQEKMHLWGHLFSKVEVLLDGKAVFCRVNAEELARYGTTKEDLEGFVDFMRRLRGGRIACLMREEHSQACKISLRSSGDDNVQLIAAQFSGGGHKNASGALVDMPMDKLFIKLIEAMKEMV